jgi:pimeloyl-ACP methyl ester carboxylesterase
LRTLWKVIKAVFLSVVALVVLLVGAGLAFRAHRQNQIADTLAIRTSNGIDEARYVKIGGIDQWIQIRGQDRDNPVLLCLHGGPGGSWLGQTALLLSWEKEFTVVLWDQRGTGKTLESTGSSIAATMSVARMAEDGIEVSEYLRAHLHKEKIFLLGFSWGSLLGIRMVKQHPELFYAYIGTGQVANMQKGIPLSYAYALEKARAAGDTKSVQLLERIGPPPFDSMEKIGTFFQTLGKYECESDRNAPLGALFAPNLSLWDIYNLIRGFAQVPTFRVYNEMLTADLSLLGTDFQIPMFFLQGERDERTQASLTKEYFDTIRAPHKEFVLFEGAGHFAVFTERGRFHRELVSRVRPLTTPNS